MIDDVGTLNSLVVNGATQDLNAQFDSISSAKTDRYWIQVSNLRAQRRRRRLHRLCPQSPYVHKLLKPLPSMNAELLLGTLHAACSDLLDSDSRAYEHKQ